MRCKHWALVLLISAMSLGAAQAAEPLRDSLRVEVSEGIRYVIHQVEAGETLWALSRRYGVSQQAIVQANPGAAEALSVNQLLRVPLGAARPEKQVVHTVAPGETLFALSRRFEVSVADIKQWNNLTSNDLSVGQQLVIKAGPPPNATSVASNNTTETTTTQTTPPTAATGVGTHVVAPQETLYSISRRYEVKVADIKRWNNLTSNEIAIGQTLYVKEPGGNAPQQVTTPANPMATTPVGNDSTPAEEPEAQEVVEATPQVTTETPTRVTESVLNLGDNYAEDNSTGFKKITEKGLCEVIEGSGETPRYLAMHRTAPIGTIMQVRNEMNDFNVFVRIVGRLPDTDENAKVLIKISEAAYERLGAIDPRFPVEITYIP